MPQQRQQQQQHTASDDDDPGSQQRRTKSEKLTRRINLDNISIPRQWQQEVAGKDMEDMQEEMRSIKSTGTLSSIPEGRSCYKARRRKRRRGNANTEDGKSKSSNSSTLLSDKELCTAKLKSRISKDRELYKKNPELQPQGIARVRCTQIRPELIQLIQLHLWVKTSYTIGEIE
jgi:hypothetical protein